MLKHIHLLFVVIVVLVFVGRVYLAQFKPELLANKWIKLGPHILAAVLLFSGIGLVFQGNWLAGDYGWIVAKVVLMLVFIALGILTIKSQGEKRWLAFAGALFSVIYIVKIAITKQVFFF